MDSRRSVLIHLLMPIILVMLVGFQREAKAETQDPVPLRHEIRVLSRGKIRLTAQPDLAAPSAPELSNSLARSGWKVTSARLSKKKIVELELELVEPLPSAEGSWVLSVPIQQISSLLAPGRPTGEVKLFYPNSLEARWPGEQPLSETEEAMSFTTFVLDPKTDILTVELDQRADLGRYARWVVVWPLLPIAAGWLLPYWLLRRFPPKERGKFPPVFNLIVPLLIALMFPLQTIYQRWFVGWFEWQFGDRLVVTIAGSLPLLITYGLACYPLLRMIIGAMRQLQPWERALSGRMILVRMLPVIITVVLNLVLILTPFFDLVLTERWAALVVEAVLLLVGLLLSPALIRWVFRPLPLGGPMGEEVAEMARQSNVSLRGIYLIPGRATSPFVNAMAVGLLPSQRMILFTEDLMTEFRPEEVRAVAAHEVAHLRFHHLIKRVLLLLIVPVFLIAIFPLLPGAFRMDPFLRIIVSVAFTYLVFTAISRWHECEADRYAAQMVGVDSMVGALDHLGRWNDQPQWWGKWFWWLLTHPPLTDRLKRVRAMG